MVEMLRRSHCFCFAALFFLLLGLLLMALQYQEGSRNYTLKLEASNVYLADTMDDHQQAIELYQSLEIDNPLLAVRIMRRQWLLALAVFQESQKRDTLAANPDQENLRNKLDDLIFKLQQSGASLLNQECLPTVIWRVHNLLGASFLLQGLESLERESNLKQSRASLELAIAQFKKAIFWVDKVPDAGNMSNIPRWNLELLSTRKTLSQIVMTRPEAESKLDLKKNLATMLPESAGYMAGEPPDSRIRK